ncbi:cryptochrome/photolyase family protein [Streptomyces sp. NPDC001450]
MTTRPPSWATAWAAEHRGGRLRQEDFYRWVRREPDLLMDGGEPARGRWNHDHANCATRAGRTTFRG